MRTSTLAGFGAVLCLFAGAAHAGPPVKINSCDLGALQAAVADPSVDQVQLKRKGCIFDGPMGERDTANPIKIDANGATFILDGEDERVGLYATGGGDVKVMRAHFEGLLSVEDIIDIRNSGETGGFYNGVLVEVPTLAEGEIVVELVQVSVERARRHGIHVDDLGIDADNLVKPDIGGSPASVKLIVESSSFTDNGYEQHDQDGVRVDESGDGDIVAVFNDVVVTGASSDGVELDESGFGSVSAQAYHSVFSDNGPNPNCDYKNYQDPGCPEPDPDDGFDIDEADTGEIWFNGVLLSMNGNFDEGLDLDEFGDGSVNVVVANSNFDENVGEGIKIEEDIYDDDPCTFDFTGDINVSIISSSINGTEDQEGVVIGEGEGGDLNFSMSSSEASENDKEGVQIEETCEGDLTVVVVNTVTNYNVDEGLKIEETDAGDLDVTVRESEGLGNGGDADLLVDEGGPGAGVYTGINNNYDIEDTP